MVLDKELQLDLVEHAAMLQNKAMIQNNVLAKRKQQLEHWENSEMNQICPKRNHYQLSKVKFQNSDIFLSACQSGDEDEVEELLKKGSDINSSNIDGVTALHQAVIDGNMDIVRFLVQHNADINAQDNEGDRELPVDLAENDEMRNYLEEVMRLKEVDERKARESEFNAMLEDCDRWIQSGKCLDTPHPKTGATALHVAASKGYVQLIEKLINSGADINAPDFEGWTPLHAAAHWGEREACRILVENGANFDTLTYFGHSVLSVADKSIEEYLYNLKEEQEKARLDEAAKMSSAINEDTNEEEENEKTINQVKEGSVESGNSNGSNNGEEEGVTATEEVEQVEVEGTTSTSTTSNNQTANNSHSNSPSVEENSSSNTGSGISSIQTTSRSVTPKDVRT
uniref:ANK_REP_REGION domain-containing protein n=1 Tax=Meloidogyne floridensis TaxID=298350 RepID=A0A915P6M8_9BILA